MLHRYFASKRLWRIRLFAGMAFLSLVTPAYPQTGQPSQATTSTQINQTVLTLDEALRLANAQASTYQTAILNEHVAAEDVKQAQAAFKPKVSAPLSYIYT